MGIYINGLDFHSPADKDGADPVEAAAVVGKPGAMPTMADDFRFIATLGSALPGGRDGAAGIDRPARVSASFKRPRPGAVHNPSPAPARAHARPLRSCGSSAA